MRQDSTWIRFTAITGKTPASSPLVLIEGNDSVPRQSPATYVRRLLDRARGVSSHHWYKEQILGGQLSRKTIAKLNNPRPHRSYERRMRLLGRILDHMGDKEEALTLFRGLLKRNPAQPLWLKYAVRAPAHDVVLLDQHHIAYCPIPKNASSSIKARLNFLSSGSNDVFSHRFFTNVYETSQTIDVPDLEHFFSFTVIRDPVERLLSYYQKNIIEEGSLVKELELNRAREIIPTRPTPEEFVEQLSSYIFYFDDVHHHTLAQSAYLKTTLRKLSRVYQIHETDSIFRELSNLTGVNLSPTYLLKSNTGTKELLLRLSDSAVDKLRVFYSQDYELLQRWLTTRSIS
jgi:hypothetical protein